MATVSEEELINQLADEVADRARVDYLDLLERTLRRCESPIERVLLAALMAEPIDGIEFFDTNEPFLSDVISATGPPCVEWSGAIYAQVPVGKYRPDIFIQVFDQATGKNWFSLVIECDGHDFHERTKEQASRDKRRDRWFQTRGIAVLRFTGSNIWRDPRACVEEITEAFFAAEIRRRRGV